MRPCSHCGATGSYCGRNAGPEFPCFDFCQSCQAEDRNPCKPHCTAEHDRRRAATPTVAPVTLVAVAALVDTMVISLPRPARHPDLRKAMDARGWFQPLRKDSEYTWGFLDSNGCFHTRESALEIARNANQVQELFGSVLTSEDLW